MLMPYPMQAEWLSGEIGQPADTDTVTKLCTRTPNQAWTGGYISVPPDVSFGDYKNPIATLNFSIIIYLHSSISDFGQIKTPLTFCYLLFYCYRFA